MTFSYKSILLNNVLAEGISDIDHNPTKHPKLLEYQEYWQRLAQTKSSDRNSYIKNLEETIRVITDILLPENNHAKIVSNTEEQSHFKALPDSNNSSNKGYLYDHLCSRIQNNDDYQDVPDLMISLISYASLLKDKAVNDNKIIKNSLCVLFPQKNSLACIGGLQSNIYLAKKPFSERSLSYKIHDEFVSWLSSDIMSKKAITSGNEAHLAGSLNNIAGISNEIVKEIDPLYQIGTDDLILSKIWPQIRDYDKKIKEILEDRIATVLKFYNEIKKNKENIKDASGIAHFISENLAIKIDAHGIVKEVKEYNYDFIEEDALRKIIKTKIDEQSPGLTTESTSFYAKFLTPDLNITESKAIEIITKLINGKDSNNKELNDDEKELAQECGLFALRTLGRKFKDQSKPHFLAIMQNFKNNISTDIIKTENKYLTLLDSVDILLQPQNHASDLYGC